MLLVKSTDELGFINIPIRPTNQTQIQITSRNCLTYDVILHGQSKMSPSC